MTGLDEETLHLKQEAEFKRAVEYVRANLYLYADGISMRNACTMFLLDPEDYLSRLEDETRQDMINYKAKRQLNQSVGSVASSLTMMVFLALINTIMLGIILWRM